MSMLALVPQSLMEGKDRKLLAEKLLGEIMKDYEKSMRRCVGKYQKLHSTNITILMLLSMHEEACSRKLQR